MTRPIYEPSTQRQIRGQGFTGDQLLRRPSPTSTSGNYPLVFRAAIGQITDPEANRVHYVRDDEGDNVYWDQWDLSYDDSVFSTSGYIQTNDPDEGPVLAGLALLQRGLYSIRAIVDIDAAINGMTSMKTNYDDGQHGAHYVDNIAGGGDPYWGDFYGFNVNDWRFHEVTNPDLTPPNAFYPDSFFGGEAEDIEIVFDCNTAIDGFGVFGAKAGGSPGDDVWIPGFYDGAWGLVPNLIVMYWGDIGIDRGSDPDWPASFGLTRT